MASLSVGLLPTQPISKELGGIGYKGKKTWSPGPVWHFLRVEVAGRGEVDPLLIIFLKVGETDL